MSLQEGAAVLLAVIYLVLAIKEIRWCWLAGFASALLYLEVFFQAALYMEAALQIFYMAMSVYGWWCWRPRHVAGNGTAEHLAERLPDHVIDPPIQRRPMRWPVRALIGVVLLALFNGWILHRSTDAAWPYIDAFISWGAILTTWMVAQKLLENWCYWLVLDSLTLLVAIERSLHLTAALFALYLVLAVIGWRSWLLRWRSQLPVRSPV